MHLSIGQIILCIIGKTSRLVQNCKQLYPQLQLKAGNKKTGNWVDIDCLSNLAVSQSYLLELASLLIQRYDQIKLQSMASIGKKQDLKQSLVIQIHWS